MATSSPTPVFVLKGSHTPVSSLSFVQPNSENEAIRYLSSGSQDGFISIWDLKLRTQQLHWQGHDASTLWLFFENRERLWSCGRREGVTLWDTHESTAKKIRTFSMGDYLGFSLCDLTFEDARGLLCIPGPEQEIVTVWDARSAEKIVCLTPPPREPKIGCVMQCKWMKSDCGTLGLLVAYENGFVSLWDWNARKIVSTVNCEDTPICLEFDPTVNKVVCGSPSEKVFTFSISGMKIEHKTELAITNPGVASLACRGDGKIFALGGWDYRIRLFSWKRHKPLAVLMYHKKTVDCLAFSNAPVQGLSKGYLLAAGSCDNSISLWDLYN